MFYGPAWFLGTLFAYGRLAGRDQEVRSRPADLEGLACLEPPAPPASRVVWASL